MKDEMDLLDLLDLLVKLVSVVLSAYLVCVEVLDPKDPEEKGVCWDLLELMEIEVTGEYQGHLDLWDLLGLWVKMDLRVNLVRTVCLACPAGLVQRDLLVVQDNLEPPEIQVCRVCVVPLDQLDQLGSVESGVRWDNLEFKDLSDLPVDQVPWVCRVTRVTPGHVEGRVTKAGRVCLVYKVSRALRVKLVKLVLLVHPALQELEEVMGSVGPWVLQAKTEWEVLQALRVREVHLETTEIGALQGFLVLPGHPDPLAKLPTANSGGPGPKVPTPCSMETKRNPLAL